MRSKICLFIWIFGAFLSGCTTDNSGIVTSAPGGTSPTSLTLQNPAELKYYPSDEPSRLALEHFNRGQFGIAAQYFEDAVTKAPEDAKAWIGLAASYDRIGRFDLADRAYKQAIRLAGETTEILNNEGYSYMLRGQLPQAKQKLLAAYKRDPHNQIIINNLQLLNSSEKFIRRDD